MSQKIVAEKLQVSNARIGKMEGEKRLHPERWAERDRPLNTLLENETWA